MKTKIFKILVLSALPLLSGSLLADSIRTENGTVCTMNTDESAFKVTLDLELGDQDSYHNNNNGINVYNNRGEADEFKAVIGFEYAVGAPKGLDCNKLYLNELKLQRALVAKQIEELKQIRSANEIKWAE